MLVGLLTANARRCCDTPLVLLLLLLERCVSLLQTRSLTADP